MSFSDWIGTIGVTILLFAYFLTLLKYLKSDSYLYLGLNILGAGLSCYASYLIDFLPFVILEGTWTLVSVVMFLKIFLKNRSV